MKILDPYMHTVPPSNPYGVVLRRVVSRRDLFNSMESKRASYISGCTEGFGAEKADADKLISLRGIHDGGKKVNIR